jgi:hypothetical protein
VCVCVCVCVCVRVCVCVQRDWGRDCNGQESLDEATMHNALFEIAGV